MPEERGKPDSRTIATVALLIQRGMTIALAVPVRGALELEEDLRYELIDQVKLLHRLSGHHMEMRHCFENDVLVMYAGRRPSRATAWERPELYLGSKVVAVVSGTGGFREVIHDYYTYYSWVSHALGVKADPPKGFRRWWESESMDLAQAVNQRIIDVRSGKMDMPLGFRGSVGVL